MKAVAGTHLAVGKFAAVGCNRSLFDSQVHILSCTRIGLVTEEHM